MQQLAQLKRDHTDEMQQIESYVEQIKSLSDERETLTMEFEKENETLKAQLDRGESCQTTNFNSITGYTPGITLSELYY